MKRILLAISTLLLGIGILIYPTLSNYLFEKNGSYAINGYTENIKYITEEELNNQVNKADEYNKSLTGENIIPPFMEGSGMVRQNDYKEILNINGSMGYINIPKIDVKLSIHHGTSEETLKKGVGHLEGTSLPIGGENTHTVLTGHTGLSNARLFTDLTELEIGDRFYVNILDKVLAYEIDQIKVVEPDEIQDLLTVRGQDYATLVTCTPYGINSHRLLVRGERVDYTPNEEEYVEQNLLSNNMEKELIMNVVVTTSIIMIILICIVYFKVKKIENNKKDTDKK